MFVYRSLPLARVMFNDCDVLRGFVPERLLVRPVRCEHVLCGWHGDLVHGVPERPDGARGLILFDIVWLDKLDRLRVRLELYCDVLGRPLSRRHVVLGVLEQRELRAYRVRHGLAARRHADVFLLLY